MEGAALRTEGDALVLTGVVDFDSVPLLIGAAAALPATKFRSVDVSQVERIDSSGVAFLVWLKKYHGEPGEPLSLRDAPAQLSSLLSVTGLSQVLDSS